MKKLFLATIAVIKTVIVSRAEDIDSRSNR